MKIDRLPGIKRIYQALNLLSFIAALLALSFIGWTTRLLVQYPNDGIYSLQRSGEINLLWTGGPADGRLSEGDIILRIEDVPYDKFRTYSSDLGKEIGDTVDFFVLRDGREVDITVPLAAPGPALIFDRLAPVFLALCFWLVGVGVGAFRSGGKSGDLLLLWFQISAMAITAGAASTVGPIWTSNLFNGLMWFVGPLSVQFHASFPENQRSVQQRRLQAVLYLLALAGVAPLALLSPAQQAAIAWWPVYNTAGRLFLVFNLFLAVRTLVQNYQHADVSGSRGKIRLVMLGFGITAVVFTALTVLPLLLFDQPLVPYSISFLTMILLPLTYAYAIFRLNFIEIDRQINRGATYILVYSILGGFYLVLYAALSQMALVGTDMSPLWNTILVLILASVFFPLRGRVQRIVDQIFYGGWYDYRLGVRLITHDLEQITDLRDLGRTITLRLEKTLRLVEAVVFFRSQSGDFDVIEASFTRSGPAKPLHTFPALPRSSLTYLLKIGVVERGALMRKLAQVTLSPEELQLLKTEQIHLWVPVIGHGQVLGLLALGPKVGGDVFSSEDLDILRVVVQQLAPLVENIHLVTRLKDYAEALEVRVEQRTIELHDAKERVEAILASVGDGVIVTDLDGKIQRINTSFEGLTGLAAEEVISTSLFQLFSDESESPQVSGLQVALRSHQNWSGELSGRRQDGSRYDIQFTLAPVNDRQGEVVNFVATLTDITRKKELERLKDMFISDVSHELRTPITNIRLYLELLDRASPDQKKRFLTVIKEQSEVLTKLVEDILDLSRLTISRARKIQFMDVDLNTLVEQVITAHLPLAEANGLQLMYEAEFDLPPVRAEQNQIGRMITNLVSNAIRYTAKGTVCVRTSRENGGVALVVEDTGIGIEPQDLPHLYERFYRGKNVRQSETHGTGLGLAIVKEIIDVHEGRIDVRSVPGQGTAFHVWIPEAVAGGQAAAGDDQ